MNSRGRRTQRRADERRQEKAERRKRLELQLSFRPKKKRKIKNDGGDVGFFESMRNVITGEKASNVTTPPMAPIKPKYGDKKMVKAIKPKKKK